MARDRGDYSISRRSFCWTLLSGGIALLIATQVVRGQAVTTIRRVGWLSSGSKTSPARVYAAFKWRAVFFAVGIFFNFVAMPLGAYYLAQNGHENFALAALGVWILSLIWSIATYPLRWRARRKFWKAFKSLQMVYYLLGKSTISPRKLKEALDAATTLGCQFDGAVFSIVDRIVARDPTAFIPSKSR